MKIYTGKLNPIFEQLKERALKAHETPQFRTYRAELIHRLAKGLNKAREGKYKPLKENVVAILVNRNPLLAGKRNDGELSALIQRCEEKGNFSYFWYVIKQK